jgi:hypothetical protein
VSAVALGAGGAARLAGGIAGAAAEAVGPRGGAAGPVAAPPMGAVGAGGGHWGGALTGMPWLRGPGNLHPHIWDSRHCNWDSCFVSMGPPPGVLVSRCTFRKSGVPVLLRFKILPPGVPV